MTRLAILALLHQHPMHGYEIQQQVDAWGAERWTNVLPGSIYFALNKMEQEGLVRAEAEERTGNRLRRIYGITEAGRREYLSLLRQALTNPPHSLKSDFSLSVGLADALSRDERRQLLERNLEEIERLRKAWEAAGTIKTDRLSRTIIDNDLQLLEQDARLIEKLMAINEDRWEASAERIRGTHVVVKTTGDYRGNRYVYEETVPIAKYERSRWWSWFKSPAVFEVLRKVPQSWAGDVFTIDDPGSRSVTEFRIVHLGPEGKAE